MAQGSASGSADSGNMSDIFSTAIGVLGLQHSDFVTSEGVYTTLAMLSMSGIMTIWWTLFDFIARWSEPMFRSIGINTLDRRQRSFLLSTVHALIVATFAAYKLLWARQDDYTWSREIITVTMGYFVNDWLGNIKQWFSHRDEFIHHVLAIAVTFCVVISPALQIFIPSFLAVEGSTLFYNSQWFLTKQGKQSTMAYKVTTALFVLSFFLLRVVWLPYATYDVIVRNTEKWHNMGLFKHTLIPICMLQYYWFSLIMRKVYALVYGKKGGKGKKDVKNDDDPKEK